MESLAETRDLEFARVRERSGVWFVYLKVGEWGLTKEWKKGLKPLIWPKITK